MDFKWCYGFWPNHSQANVLASGYLGVDIFFVISGYVITLSLLPFLGRPLGEFLASFYTRRIKRLMPALILCVLGSATVLYGIDPRPDVLFWTGISALIGVSNIYLYI